MSHDPMSAAAYTIEEASEITGVSRHTLRYYERIGLLTPVQRDPSGHRRYGDDDLGWVTFLTLLRQTGMPIRGMLRFTGLTREGDATIAERVELLRAHRGELSERLQLLQRHLAALDNKIDFYSDVLRQAQTGELV